MFPAAICPTVSYHVGFVQPVILVKLVFQVVPKPAFKKETTVGFRD